MTRYLILVSALVVSCLLCPSPVGADDRAGFAFSTTTKTGDTTIPQVPRASIHPAIREQVQSVLERPSLTARGQSETFLAQGHVYRWLLNHPDWTVKLWKQVGAKVSEVQNRSDGFHVWHDDQGSEVAWRCALESPGMHVWYAEGKVKPAALLPLTHFRAVAIMIYTEGQDNQFRSAIRHQVHFLLRCDSKAVALAAKILGASAPRMTEQYLGQLQMFYGGMAWYLGQNPDRAKKVYRQVGLVIPEDSASAGTP